MLTILIAASVFSFASPIHMKKILPLSPFSQSEMVMTLNSEPDFNSIFSYESSKSADTDLESKEELPQERPQESPTPYEEMPSSIYPFEWWTEV